MAQSIWYRILSALLLLVIVFPGFPVEALPRAEAAEVEPTNVTLATATPPDFAVPRPAMEAEEQQPAVIEDGLSTSWKEPNPAPAAAPLFALRPGEDYVFVALDGNNGVARWDGTQWDPVNEGLANEALYVHQIAADPFDPNILLIATMDGVYKTTDALDTCTWSLSFPYSHPDTKSNISSIVAAPWQRGKFFAGSAGVPNQEPPYFFTTTDGGSTWSEFALPLIPPSPHELYSNPADICLGTGNEKAVYIPDSNNIIGRRRFWKSTDGGSSFAIVPDLIAGAATDCAMEPGGDPAVYMADGDGGSQLQRSTDGGESWDDKRPGTADYPDVEVSPFDYRLWTVGNRQIFRSDDQGDSWVVAKDGLERAPRTIGFGAPGEIWVGGHRDPYVGSSMVWHSTDNGSTWSSDDALANTVIDIVPLNRYFYPALPNDQCNSPGPSCGLNGACGWAQRWLGGEINTANGNHTYQVQDLSVPTLGGALTFERTYASQHADDRGPLGYGWTHNYSMTVDPPDDANDPLCVVTTADGSRLRFFVQFNGPSATFTAYPGVQGILAYDPIEHAYYLTDTAQTAYVFNGYNGKLLAINDPQGHRTTLTYDYESDRLQQVTGPDGQSSLGFTYDGDQLQAVCDHTNRCVTFSYNSQTGNLEAATDVRGYDWQYTYWDEGHLLKEVRDPNDHLVERTQYDTQDRAISQTIDAAVVPTLQITYTVGGTRVITDARLISQMVHYDGRNTWGGTQDATGHAITRTYEAGTFNLNYVADANGNPTELVWSECGCRPEVITDALGHETHMLYDAHNNLISTTDALNHTTLYTYSSGTIPPDVPPDLLIETRDALGYHTYYTYSTEGNGLGIPAGLLELTKDSLNHETSYAYNIDGQLMSTRVLSGGQWLTTQSYDYDDLGRVIQTTNALGHIDVTFYDGGGYVTRTVANCTAGSYEDCRTVVYSALSPDENIVTGYAYDGVGNRVRVTNTLGIATRYDYDAANRLIRVTENYQNGEYNPLIPDEDITTTYGYDAAGNQVVVTDSAGFATRTFYDELNRPITVTQNYVGSGSYVPYDPQYPNRNISTSYGYDNAGNQVTVTNPLGMVTVTAYDELNRPAQVTENYTTVTPNPDPSTYNLVTSYAYDAGGNQISVRDPREVVTRHTYDALNRVVAITENYTIVPNGLPGPEMVATYYEYDARGNRTAVENPLGVRTLYEYDDLNRLVKVVENPIEPYIQGNDLNITTRYRYDLLGNRTWIIDPLGTKTRNYYDNLGRTVEVWENWANTPNGGDDENIVTRYQYDGLGRRTAVINALDIQTRYYYDDLGRTVEVKENVVDLPAEQSDENVRTIMVYDQRGNRIALIDPESYTTTYDYDALARLVMVTDPLEHETVYAYDAAGNRTSVTDANENTIHYTYDGLGRVVAVEDALDQTTHYAYDAGGNRIAITDAAGLATRYDYDAFSQLITVTENYVFAGPSTADTNVVTSYGYDLLGNLTVITNARDYVTTYTYSRHEVSRIIV